MSTVVKPLEGLIPELAYYRFIPISEIAEYEFNVYSSYYIFKQTEKEVPYNKLTNRLKVRLYSEKGDVYVYDLKDKPSIYLVEVLPRGYEGKGVYFEVVELHYYTGEDEPEEEFCGYVSLSSNGFISLMSRRQASELIETLVRKLWRVHI